LNGGEQTVLSGGKAVGTTILNGSYEVVSASGVTSGGSISSGGREDVYGSASGTTVNVGGVEYIRVGGVASGTILNGAEQAVLSGGKAVGTTVLGGGYEVVSSGGSIAGGTIGGGTLEIMSGATANAATIGFSSSGTLKLDNSQAFTSASPLMISGFGGPSHTDPDRIDLANIAYATAQLVGYSGSTQSGMLTITDGIHTANLLLFGQYTAASFHLSKDGGTGTIVTDPPTDPTTSSMVAQLVHS
jgi:autotransporter passenger strand-loop-strand repeat protein